MIVPTRFGLKYAPIPTLALEYVDDLKGVVDSSAASLYVYRDRGSAPPPGPARKLHVVELPMLTSTSETQQVLHRLQQDNGRFLAPGVVNEAQLKRLLDRLVANLQMSPEPQHSTEGDDDISPPASRHTDSMEPTGKFGHEQEGDAEVDKRSERIGDADEPNGEVGEHDGDLVEEEEHEESFLEESIAEASQSLEHDQTEKEEVASASRDVDVAGTNPNRGAFLSQEEESGEEEDKEDSPSDRGAASEQPADEEGQIIQGRESSTAVELEGVDTTDSATAAEDEKEKEDDAEKVRALRSEEEVSDEDLQSEELEYFSEDGSDEDSF